MKLKYNFATSAVADKTVAVSIGEDLEKFNGFIKMNDNAAYIFELLKNDITLDEIVEKMKQDFSEPEEELRAAAEELISILSKADMLE